MTEPKTAQEWAEWAAGFLGWTPEGPRKLTGGRWYVGVDGIEVDIPEAVACECYEPFCPLHDLNHLGLVKAEIRRRGYFLHMTHFPSGVVTCSAVNDDLTHDGAGTENLAVLRAAFALAQEGENA